MSWDKMILYEKIKGLKPQIDKLYKTKDRDDIHAKMVPNQKRLNT